MPASFIPIAETSGLIVPLGEWVLRQACRQAQIWWKTGYHLRMAVNLSAIQLREPGFALLIERVLAENDLSGDVLELEVTERVFLDPSKAAITKTLRKVTEMGVQLAIDDLARAIPASVTSRTSPLIESRLTPHSCGTSASRRGPRRS